MYGRKDKRKAWKLCTEKEDEYEKEIYKQEYLPT